MRQFFSGAGAAWSAAACVSVMAALFALPARGQETGSSVPTAHLPVIQLLDAAYHHSPALQAARAQLRAVQETYPEALANYQPTITATAGINDEDLDSSNFAGADGATTKDIGVNLDQPLYRGGRSGAQKREAKARIKAETAALHAVEQRLFADVLRAAARVQMADDILDIRRRSESLYAKLVEDTRRRVEGGEATRTDQAVAESRHAGAVADRLAAETETRQSRLRLQRLTGIEALRISPLGLESIAALPSAREIAQRDAGAHALEAERMNADRAVLAALHEADEHVVRDVFGELLPRLNFLARWGRAWDPSPGVIDEQTSRELGLRLTVPLYEGGGTRARVRQARNRHVQSGHTLDDFDLQLREDIWSAHARYLMLQSRRQVLARQAEMAEQARANTEKEVLGGEKTLTDLLQTDTTWLEARLALSAAMEEEADRLVEMMRLTGRLAPARLGIVTGPPPEEYLRQVRHRVLSTRLPD